MSLVHRHRKTGIPRSKRAAFTALLGLALFAVALCISIWFLHDWVAARALRYVKYEPIIVRAAERNGVDPRLIRAVIWRESGFDRNAFGKKGEIGLMQIMPKFGAQEWAKAHHEALPSSGALADPELNIEIGSWYLGRALQYWREYSDYVALALCEYNAGRVRTESWKPETKDGTVINRIGIPSTRCYVEDILKKYREYQDEVNE